MPGKFSLQEAMAKLQAHVQARGADCIRGLGRAFMVVDTVSCDRGRGLGGAW